LIGKYFPSSSPHWSPKSTGKTDRDFVCPFVGHKLQTPWSFWYSKKTSGSSASAEGFSSSLKHLGTFDTIEGFAEYATNVIEAPYGLELSTWVLMN
jgi:hypothetical protein